MDYVFRSYDPNHCTSITAIDNAIIQIHIINKIITLATATNVPVIDHTTLHKKPMMMMMIMMILRDNVSADDHNDNDNNDDQFTFSFQKFHICLNITFSPQYVTTMGDSQLSPPLSVKTPYNKTDLDEFRDSLGEQN